MVTDASASLVPQAPFVIITRKGGFPATSLAEACRLVRPLVSDGKAAVTDAAGQRFAPREFLKAAEAAVEAKERTLAVTEVVEPALHDWASKTSDLDLEGGASPSWLTAAPASVAPKTPRSSDRNLGRHSRKGPPTSDRRSISSRRPISDRRSSRRNPAEAVVISTGEIVLVGGLVVAGAIIAWLAMRAPVSDPPPAATKTPQNVAPPPPVPEPRMRLEDRPLPSYMR